MSQSAGVVTVVLTGLGNGAVEVRAKLGFEVLGGDNMWHTVSITGSTSTSVTLAAVTGATAVRYLFQTAPCTAEPYACAVYVSVPALGDLSGQWDFLPLGPFVLAL